MFTNSMKIKEMPFFTRPSFKLVKNGVDFLDDSELLAVVLWIGTKNQSALELSSKLLRKYNFNRLEDLSIKELAEECDKNFSKALQVASLIEICKRYNKLIKNGYTKVVSSAKDVFNMYSDRFINEKRENFMVLCLNNKNKVIREYIVSVGILDSSLVHPREVFKVAVRESAYAIILVHNHPSGDCNPSRQDLDITNVLMEVGRILIIPVIDHVIIGKESYYSFKERLEKI